MIEYFSKFNGVPLDLDTGHTIGLRKREAQTPRDVENESGDVHE